METSFAMKNKVHVSQKITVNQSKGTRIQQKTCRKIMGFERVDSSESSGTSKKWTVLRTQFFSKEWTVLCRVAQVK